MGWLIAAGVLVLIAILPVGVNVVYDEDGLRVCVFAGPVRIPVYPAKKEPKKKKPQKDKKAAGGKTAVSKPQKKKGGSIQDFLPILDKAMDFLSAFRRKLRVNILEMKLVLGGGDPCDLAVNYGKGWTVLGNLMPLLENAFLIKKRDLEVECDFLAEKTTILARMDVSITIGRIISLLTVQGIPLLQEFLKLINKRKGGAKA